MFCVCVVPCLTISACYYYWLQAAQEKEELQREGDDLDARIRKAEKEIRALENTLKLMNNRNETYRKSFNKVTDASKFGVFISLLCLFCIFKLKTKYCTSTITYSVSKKVDIIYYLKFYNQCLFPLKEYLHVQAVCPLHFVNTIQCNTKVNCIK